MRVPYVGVLASLVVAVGCARGDDIPGGHVQALDAGVISTPVDNGGAAGEPMTSGGTVGAGGDGSGNVAQGEGGSTSSGSGGTTASTGGKTASGGTSSSSGGKSSSGGTTASGGTSSSSGGKATGGTTGTAGTSGDAGSCKATEKFCGGLCTPPAPRVGCGLTGCNACTTQAPANGYITCANNQCVFDCLSGYAKMGSACVGNGTGGSNSGSCNPSKCPVCNVVSGPACCTSNGKCGCPAVPWVTQTCAVPI